MKLTSPSWTTTYANLGLYSKSNNSKSFFLMLDEAENPLDESLSTFLRVFKIWSPKCKEKKFNFTKILETSLTRHLHFQNDLFWKDAVLPTQNVSKNTKKS